MTPGAGPAFGQVPVLALDEIDSTNAEARRRAEAGEGGPLWITALRQTAGRGRRGRNWETGKGGNLAATLLLLTDKPPAEAAQISFLAALAVSDLVKTYVRAAQPLLKWPNDVLVGGRKISGILVESGRRADGKLWLAAGIGVNLAEAPQAADRPATTFAAEGCDPPPAPREALDRLSSSLSGWLGVWESQGFAAIAEAWTRRAQGLGGPCQARLGAETVEGVAEGLDLDGALRLRLPGGEIRRITAGEVFFEGA
ncbi:biotin--[acetyl-CoA-carboxylase] ligase [Phenylobacterium montanum]|uniref:biotin--[biotin carboxyl-carrier protein] ligase n=1 Tax=Phenylobacterium montanum TaxID=2823693 RepID=A0A975G0T2_9CAUL|nr:biotin--[acetyl-CoA-carboxylase] ligase [Caulobacter sp. S6]QUD88509.1 biotin--[acetyl-CoA-carboxylase] ligase [Caulobacter sp. S6]